MATDEGFRFPDTVLSGLSHVRFENHGSTLHEAMFVKLPEGLSAEGYLDRVRGGTSFPEGARDYAGPGLTSPGEIVEQWLHLDAGNYLLVCWFRGHLKAESAHTLTVREHDSGNVTPPVENAVLSLIDFRFELQGQLRPGPQVVRVETRGPSLHEVDVFRLRDGKTIADLRAWRKSSMAGSAPVEAIGGVLDYHDISRVVWLKLNFRPGRYVLWCGMDMVSDVPGPAGDMIHADAGMLLELTIEA
jgi:hypothetical protein